MVQASQATEAVLEIDGADLEAIGQLVLAGFPATMTLADFLAYFSKATPLNFEGFHICFQ